MIVLGLDQSPRNTGWAYWSDDGIGLPASGCKAFDSYGSAHRFLMLDVRDWLGGLLDRSGATAVYFEQIIIDFRHVDVPVFEEQQAVTAAIEFTCMDRGVEPFKVLIGQWRKLFLGRANAPKDEGRNSKKWLKEAAMRAAFERGWKADSEHEAEALGIMHYGLAHASPAYRKRARAEAERRQFKARRLDAQR